MPFLIGCFALIAPRVVIILLVILTDYIGHAYKTTLWPFLGFLFLPLTTLAYAWAINSHGSVEGFRLAVVVVAALMSPDAGAPSSGASPSISTTWLRRCCFSRFSS